MNDIKIIYYDDIYNKLKGYTYRDKETMFLVIQKNNKLIVKDITVNADEYNASFYIEDIVEYLKKYKASDFVLAHTHLNESCRRPSPEDIGITKEVVDYFKNTNYNFLDHMIIVRNNSYYSFVKNNAFGISTLEYTNLRIKKLREIADALEASCK